jgi:DNA-binding IclR family transcriptional regulator
MSQQRPSIEELKRFVDAMTEPFGTREVAYHFRVEMSEAKRQLVRLRRLGVLARREGKWQPGTR